MSDFPLAQTLRDARRKQGLTQEALGNRLRIPQTHVSAMEAGTVDVRASTLIAWTRALGLELLLLPREVVPAVQFLKKEMAKPEPNTARPSQPLYGSTEMDEDEEDEPAPRP
ncbi:helix-turn-helix domain-containing protein [Tardiphaga sp. 1201_B9_N1_1]|jgi:transcriptional regulator with XRE-family HTH domain|uniref:helix-turn-helix domain-containing protein n=1 Tax=unclassified Tardiphaga TaxID=2631404 RepID=UPI003F22D270